MTFFLNPSNYNAFISKTNWALTAAIVIAIGNAVLPFIPTDAAATLTTILSILAMFFHQQGVNKAAVTSASLGTAASGQ